MKSVCVYCGSSAGRRPEYAEAARRLGEELVARGLDLVYGGSSVGIMKVVADAVLERGGRVTGVIPEALVRKEIAHRGLTELHVTASMHERKMRMAELSDAFVALPGGFGTFEEVLEITTWAQLGMHKKPVVVLDVEDYYAPLFALLDHGVREGFVKRENRELVTRVTSIAALFQHLERFVPHETEAWIDAGST